MWVIFRKSDKKVLSTSPGPRGAGKKNGVLEEVVRGLEGAPAVADVDAIEVEDERAVLALSEGLALGRVTVEPTKEGGLTLVDAAPELTIVLVTTDAQQFHPVDNVPLIAGNGTAFLTVTLQKVKQDGGTPLTRVTKDNEVIWLRTDHGTLREDKDGNPQEIRSVKLASGTAKFRIYSENAKRLATVQMLSTNPALRLGGVRVEFI
ncbi:MAG TPA: hypothetical protein DD490_26150 [Acidobacteria bacterium]|nr:hypothetical protein [Acidobacteriota bacterium]